MIDSGRLLVELRHRRPWTILLFNEFKIISPDGAAIRFATRKAEGLVAILCIQRKYGVKRQELGEILWPEASETQRASCVRQTLYLCRKALGSDFIVLAGDLCHISGAVEIVSDYEEPSIRAGTHFLPGFEGPWFETFRSEVHDPVQTAPSDSLASSYFKVLAWYADHDAKKLLEVMQQNPDLVEGLPSEQAMFLLERIPLRGQFPGWKDYFVGHLRLGSDIPTSHRFLRSAVYAATKHRDRRLQNRALRYQLVASILLNRLDEAEETSRRLSDLSAERRDSSGAASNYSGRGLLRLHMGQKDEGLKLLIESENRSSSEMEMQSCRALRAFFCSSYHLSSEASELLEQPKKYAANSGHAYIQGLCDLTDWNLSATTDKLDAETLAALNCQIQSIESTHFKIYLKESLIVRHLTAGNHKEAAKLATESRKLRRFISMAYTPWDQMRLSSRN